MNQNLEGLKTGWRYFRNNNLYLWTERAVIRRLLFSVTMTRCVGKGDVIPFTMMRIKGERAGMGWDREQ